MRAEERGIHEGMTVRDRDGGALGRVERCRARTFVIAKGRPFVKRFEARYEDVVAVADGEVHMDEPGSQLEAEAFATPLDKERRSDS